MTDFPLLRFVNIKNNKNFYIADNDEEMITFLYESDKTKANIRIAKLFLNSYRKLKEGFSMDEICMFMVPDLVNWRVNCAEPKGRLLEFMNWKCQK